MNTIKVNTLNLNKSKSVIQTEIDNLNNQLQRIAGSLQYIEQNWFGTDAFMYVDTIRNTYTNELKKLVDVTEMFGKYLEIVSQEYDKVDNEQKNLFNQIEV